jgi:hypothetical protein
MSQVQGLTEFRKAMETLTRDETHRVLKKVLRKIGAPYAAEVQQQYYTRPGKHDNETMEQALQHRWWNKATRRGLPVRFSRMKTLRNLLKYGLTVRGLRRSSGVLLRLKISGNAVHLMEKGRKRGNRTYRGWMDGVNTLKRFAASAQAQLDQLLPGEMQKAIQKAAAAAGVKQ